ncbi:MAG TPA: 16S rRNA (adenine(1518)-N(6)/adenine(1519)-N(6))-dimethyltransferase RsmA [Deltaproteobacteria bacterium]|jgi:16S rRNA (adenine1518-N6/adenine1519-N6)-dimethyltransferase|nr:16S rRNA (adenine(1518)-N(6)/adenine(1519)-N(6))-dimethyltransferase RsmA [Deltaproteobacteria bacterium]HQI02379.1 16S rRNA (adenine(1518)-N(6)/adenine(1519)-N(6))-dimethyltransferase RsmA [Deltaproteobacteria bacterium]
MRPKPSLGQNFLKNPGIVDKIIRFSEVKRSDTVLEIGPGTGMLTGRLLECASRVIAVEKDDALAEALREKFGDEQGFSLIHADILECDFRELVKPGTKIVANLPYNIATTVALRLVDAADMLSSVVVMVQKEVGMRICAPPGDTEYSALTVVLSSVFECTPGFVVGPKNFSPQPKVDSLVIKLVPKEQPLPRAEMDDFKKIVFGTFGQRRKMLRNSLMSIPGVTRDLLPHIERLAGVSLEKRPQQLSWEDYQELARAYRKLVAS